MIDRNEKVMKDANRLSFTEKELFKEGIRRTGTGDIEGMMKEEIGESSRWGTMALPEKPNTSTDIPIMKVNFEEDSYEGTYEPSSSINSSSRHFTNLSR